MDFIKGYLVPDSSFKEHFQKTLVHLSFLVSPHNRTVYKYIRDGCIQCRQINKVVVEQQTNGLKTFALDHFLLQLNLYHDHSTGKFVSLRNTCRRLNQKFTRHKTILPPLHPLNLDKEQSPLWNVKVFNQAKNVQNSQKKEAQPSKEPQPSFYSPRLLFIKLTNFIKDLFKKEEVCLQCGKHGEFVPPYSTKTSMLKKFMLLVLDLPQTEIYEKVFVQSLFSGEEKQDLKNLLWYRFNMKFSKNQQHLSIKLLITSQ